MQTSIMTISYFLLVIFFTRSIPSHYSEKLRNDSFPSKSDNVRRLWNIQQDQYSTKRSQCILHFWPNDWVASRMDHCHSEEQLTLPFKDLQLKAALQPSHWIHSLLQCTELSMHLKIILLNVMNFFYKKITDCDNSLTIIFLLYRLASS